MSEFRVRTEQFEEMLEACRWAVEEARRGTVVAVDVQLMQGEDDETWVTATVTTQTDG